MKKLLIWDADETLWKGTILNTDYIAVTTERFIQLDELMKRGVLQSIASVNRHEDLMMVLRRYNMEGYFLVPTASLEATKAVMVADIVSQLGLASMGDVVFIDDNPLNRAEIKAAYPEITVYDETQISQAIKECFTKETYTEEDRNRVRRYKAEQIRRAASVAYSGDHMTFLRSCGIQLTLDIPPESDWNRVIDLVQRAHRYSAMSHAFNEDEVLSMLGEDQIVVGYVKDNFGEWGLSAILHAPCNATQSNLHMLVISCSLQGKGIGSALVGWWVNQHIGKTLRAVYEETQWNGGVPKLFEWYGFQPDQSGEGIEHYTHIHQPDPATFRVLKLQPTAPVVLPDWVKVVENDE